MSDNQGHGLTVPEEAFASGQESDLPRGAGTPSRLHPRPRDAGRRPPTLGGPTGGDARREPAVDPRGDALPPVTGSHRGPTRQRLVRLRVLVSTPHRAASVRPRRPG